QGAQRRMIQQFEETAAAAVALAKGTLVEPHEQLPDRLVEFGQGEELTLPQSRQYPALHNLYSGFHFGFVAGLEGSCRQDRDTIMRGHLLVGAIDSGFIPARLGDPGLEIVRRDDLRHATQELEGDRKSVV